MGMKGVKPSEPPPFDRRSLPAESHQEKRRFDVAIEIENKM